MRGGGKVAKAVKAPGITKATTRSPLTPEARENQMISLAMDLAEQQLRDGTASSQLITEFVKRGSTKARLEKELLERQTELAAAKAESLKSAARMEELYEKAMKAMKRYGGQYEEVDEDEYY
jgi:gamma-glutamyl:cysteine ligase YbdK (ATP-grasp superfamily)